MNSLIYIGIAFLTVSCARNQLQLQTGDLLFQVGRESEMTGAISDATTAQGVLDFSHVAIVVCAGGADSIIEASTQRGVRTITLDDFLSASAQIDGCPGVVAMRMRDTTGVATAVIRAREFLGQPYDYSYRPDNGKIYCSELVWESYLAADGSHLLTSRPMNFRNAQGELPRFWEELFEQLGEPAPEGLPGTNPNDMAREAALREVNRWF